MNKKVWYIIAALIILVAVLLSYGFYKDPFHIMTGRIAGTVSASFSISDENPRLWSDIPNKTLQLNTADEINLSSYFYEPNGDNLTFNSTLPGNIVIIINQTTGIAALTPQTGFKGRNWIIFYAYDPLNNSKASNNISIRVRSIAVYYSNFSGSTTDFSSLSDQEMQNLSNAKIEKADYGLISFAEAINISSNTDLNSNINISFNYIYINETALPELNKKAILSLYGLTTTNPRILRNGAVCPEAICTNVSYSGGTLVFNVTGFTYYSSEETPPETPAQAPTPAPEEKAKKGGGGGAAGMPSSSIYAAEKQFEVDTNTLKADVRQNKVVREIVKVSNPTDKELEVSAGLTRDIGFVRVDDKIKIAPGETKDLELVIAPTEENKPDTYITQIVLQEGDTKIQIPFVINVQSELKLLDVSMEVYSEEAYPAENLITGLKINNLEQARSITVNIKWFIKDLNDNIIVKEESTADVETQVALIKKIYLPSDMRQGDYAVIAVATYDNSSAVASSMFTVSKKSIIEMPMRPESGILILLIVVAAAVVLLIIILIFVIIYEERKIDHLRGFLRKKRLNRRKSMKQKPVLRLGKQILKAASQLTVFIKKGGVILKEISRFSQIKFSKIKQKIKRWKK